MMRKEDASSFSIDLVSGKARSYIISVYHIGNALAVLYHILHWFEKTYFQ